MKSDDIDIDDILSNIDEDGEGIEILRNQQTDKNKVLSSPVEHLKAKLENDKDDISFLYDIDSGISGESNILNNTSADESGSDENDADNGIEYPEIKESSARIKSENIPDKIKPVGLKIKGTSTWNTREPYVVRINSDALLTDYNDLEQSFYFTKSNEKEAVIIGEMKRAMFKFVRGSVQNILNEYSDFLYKKNSDTAAGLCRDFGFSDNELPFFIYHLGILTLYTIVIDRLKENQIGFCFKPSSENKVMRYIPTEFIKEITIRWHNDNIFNAGFPFDGIIEFNDLKRKIAAIYTEDVDNNKARIENLINKMNTESVPRIERDNFFKDKWIELFGKNRIVIYNRFLERTIFKGNA